MSKEKTTAAASKAGTAASPQDTAGKGTHVITANSRVSVGGKVLNEGDRVSAADFITARDPDGTRGLQRLVDGGELAKATRGTKADDDRAGGGLIDQGGATGAGPSAAQLTAAAIGNDPAAGAVVDAALSGSTADLEAANAGKPEAPKAN